MSPHSPPPRRRAEWLAARAALAGRRDARLAVSSLLSVGVVFAALYSATSGQRHDEGAWFALVAASLIVGLIAGYAINLAREMARAHVADAHEAERFLGVPVLATVSDRRLRSHTNHDALDPHRLMYLSVSPAGARTHTVIVTGDDPAIVARTAAGIAHAAATDTRATLVIDLDNERSPAAAFYRVRTEPGFSDAMAGVRLWREVTLAVGANSGLSIDVIPGGALRRDVPERTTAELTEFLLEHDFCVVVAPGARAARRAAGLIEGAMVILCIELQVTTLMALAAWKSLLFTETTPHVHGLALVEKHALSRQ